jgi:hypothetical protein
VEDESDDDGRGGCAGGPKPADTGGLSHSALSSAAVRADDGRGGELKMQVQPVQPNRTPRVSTPHIGAFLLIAIGMLMLIGNIAGGNIAGGLVVLAIGIAFGAAYVMSRKYGFLVPAGILTGLGAGILIGQWAGATDSDMGIYAVLGLGTGFLLIYAVDAFVTSKMLRFWPVIPAGIFYLAAGGLATSNEGFLKVLGLWSPLILVAIGVLLLFVRGRNQTTS